MSSTGVREATPPGALFVAAACNVAAETAVGPGGEALVRSGEIEIPSGTPTVRFTLV